MVIAVTLPVHAVTSAALPENPLPPEPPPEPPVCELPPEVLQRCGGQQKVDICHSRPNGNPQTIEVSCDVQTLCDHQGHGDDLTLESCDDDLRDTP